MYTSEIIWTTYEGRKIKLGDVTDMHLANLIDHAVKINNQELQLFCVSLAKARKLDKEFLDKAQYPHVNQQGNWAIMDYDKGYVRQISIGSKS